MRSTNKPLDYHPCRQFPYAAFRCRPNQPVTPTRKRRTTLIDLAPLKGRPMRFSTWIARITGTLLLLAAALKASGLGVDPVGRMGIFSTPEFQLAIIEFEVFLGLWLVSGLSPIGSWLTAVATFLTFACVSAYLGIIGQSSCGCFGRLSPSPWWAFALDMVVLGLLAVGRPDLKPVMENPRSKFATAAVIAICSVVGLALMLSVLLAFVHLCFGSVPAAIAYFRNERVSIQPRLIDIGEGSPGETRTVSVEVTNWTGNPIRLFGGTADCSCTVLGDLPTDIGPKETRVVSVTISLGEKAGMFTRNAAFRVDDEGHRMLRFRLTGRIVPDAHEHEVVDTR